MSRLWASCGTGVLTVGACVGGDNRAGMCGVVGNKTCFCTACAACRVPSRLANLSYAQLLEIAVQACESSPAQEQGRRPHIAQVWRRSRRVRAHMDVLLSPDLSARDKGLGSYSLESRREVSLRVLSPQQCES